MMCSGADEPVSSVDGALAEAALTVSVIFQVSYVDDQSIINLTLKMEDAAWRMKLGGS